MHLTRNKADYSVMARIMRQGKMYQKRFPVRRYKTWRAAEKEGRAWIDELKKTLPPCEMNAKGRRTNRNQSGVVGVSIAYKVTTKPSGKQYEYWSWLATWAIAKKKRTGVAWHIGAKYSDDEAFILAVLTRELETKDREKVLKLYAEIEGTPRYDEILEQKLLVLE